MRLILALALIATACTHERTREPAMDHSMHMRATAAACTAWVDQITPEQQQVINDTMATREHRLHHALWHAVRGGISQSDSQALQSKFGATWGKASPLCPAPQDNFSSQNYNPAGEDFLYMHHDMIGMLQQAFIAKNLPCIKGWAHVPTPQEWPMPDKIKTGAKSAQTLAQLQRWDEKFRDPSWLKSHSLSQVGWALEYSVHNNLHMRYATDQAPKGFDKDGAPVALDGSFPANWNFDDPKYNWLADPYGAAVNPTFWKIHGYVDSILDQWLKANDFDSIARDCAGQASCYQWKGMWTGELTLPAPSRDFPTKLGAARPPSAKQRIDLQRIGVLKDSDFPSQMPRAPRGAKDAPAGPSDDPYGYTAKSLCSN